MASASRKTNNCILCKLQTNSKWMDKESLINTCATFYSVEDIREALQVVKGYPVECSGPFVDQNKRTLLEELVSFIPQPHFSKQHPLSKQCQANKPLKTDFGGDDTKEAYNANVTFCGTPGEGLTAKNNQCFLGRSLSFGSSWGKPGASELFTEWRKNYYRKAENKEFLKSALKK